jgi:hypothetical protein
MSGFFPLFLLQNPPRVELMSGKPIPALLDTGRPGFVAYKWIVLQMFSVSFAEVAWTF